MSEEEIKEAILTLDVLIDNTKEDGTYYNAKKEWEALEVFKKLQQENSQLKQQLSILSVKPAIPTTEEKLKYRIEKAIEYMKPRFMNCIDDVNKKRYFEDYYIQEIYEILKGDKDERF